MILETHEPNAPFNALIESIVHLKDFEPDHSIERVVPTGHVFVIFELDGIERRGYAVTRFGEDVEISPKKAYVSLRRRKQFGLIQPSTRARVDVGLNLASAKATIRLEKSGSFNAMVSHRVRLSVAEDVDEQLIAWLQRAYQNAG